MNLVDISISFELKLAILNYLKLNYLAFLMMFSNLWSEKNWNSEIYRSMRKRAVSPKTAQANFVKVVLRELKIVLDLITLLFHSVNAFTYIKVHIFWEGHKILRNLHHRFERYYIGQIYGGDLAKFCGLLRIYEL